MPLFFFDTLQDGRRHTDDVGIELDDVSEAKLQACQLLSDMMSDDLDVGASTLACDVRDAKRRLPCHATMSCERRSA